MSLSVSIWVSGQGEKATCFTGYIAFYKPKPRSSFFFTSHRNWILRVTAKHGPTLFLFVTDGGDPKEKRAFSLAIGSAQLMLENKKISVSDH